MRLEPLREDPSESVSPWEIIFRWFYVDVFRLLRYDFFAASLSSYGV